MVRIFPCSFSKGDERYRIDIPGVDRRRINKPRAAFFILKMMSFPCNMPPPNLFLSLFFAPMAQLVIYLSTWQMRRAGRHNFLHKTAPTDWQALHFIPRICFECHSERNFKFQRKISIPHFSDELSALLKRNQFQSLGRITKSSLYLGIFW